MAVGKGQLQGSDLQALRAGHERVAGHDKCREVIAAVCAFGGSFQGRKQPFPPLFSGQGDIDTVF